MIKRILEQVDQNKSTPVMATCHINNPKYNTLRIKKDLIQIDFNSLYPNVLIKMYDEGLLPLEKDNIDNIRYLIENREEIKKDDDKYYQLKVTVNSYWAKLYRRDPSKANIAVEYLTHFYNELLYKHNDNIIYIDADMIIIEKLDNIIEDIEELDIPYTIKDINYFYLMSKKRYAYIDKGKLIIKGYSPSRDHKTIQDLELMMKTHIREDKLIELGI